MILAAFPIPFADSPNAASSWLLAIGGVIVIGIAKSGFGGGLGIVAVPMMVFAFGIENTEHVVGVMLPILICADIASAKHHWGRWDKQNLWHLLPGSCIGIIIAAIVLDKESDVNNLLRLVIGWVCVLYMVSELVKKRFAPKWHFQTGPAKGTAVGVLAGVVSTFAHAAGPVTSIYLLGQHLDRNKFVGTSVIYYFTVNSLKLIPYALLGFINTETLAHSLCFFVFVPIGTVIGAWFHRRMSDVIFRWFILVFIFATGVKLLWTTSGK